jgi:sulfotransferase family protein
LILTFKKCIVPDHFIGEKKMRWSRLGIIILLYFWVFQEGVADEWKRVYLATYPRSGNHWMRYLIEEATHITTSSVYSDPDHRHLPQLFPWKGYCTEHGYEKNCRYPDNADIIVVKTHFPHLERTEGDELPYIKIVQIMRHPVDCLYSLYIHSQNGHPQTGVMPRATLMGFIHTMKQFEAYWTPKENKLIVRYEDLLSDPYHTLKHVLDFIGYTVTDQDIRRAVEKYPSKGTMLKHLSCYSQKDLEYIARELKELMQKYDYRIPGVD